MQIWKQTPSLEGLQAMAAHTILAHLGLVFTEIGPDYLCARLPVDERTVQPMRILHGGASVVLAETLGSIASVLCLEDPSKQQAVGLDVNANHLRPVGEGAWVEGKCTPIQLGKSIHVWHIELRNPEGKLTCVSRLTMSIR